MNDPAAGYTVRIQDNRTGEVRQHQDSRPWEDHFFWLWTEGAMGSASNRASAFAKAGGEEPDGSLVDDDRYKAIDATLPDGRVIALDGGIDPADNLQDYEATVTH